MINLKFSIQSEFENNVVSKTVILQNLIAVQKLTNIEMAEISSGNSMK